MPISMRGYLPWLGATAALLLLAPPALADEIEPEPYAEEESEEPAPSAAADAEQAEPAADAAAAEEAEPDATAAGAADEAVADEPNIARFFDVVLLRPLYLIRLAAGLPFFVFYPLTISSGWEDDVVSALWTDPYEATFVRPLGESIGDDF